MQAFGIDLGVKMCKRLLDEGTPGLHMYTLNLEQAAVGILEALGLINKKQVSTACCAAVTHSCAHANAASASVMGMFSGLLLLGRRLLWAEHDYHQRGSCWRRGYAGVRHQSPIMVTSTCVAIMQITRPLPWRPAATSKRQTEQVRPIFWSNRPRAYLKRTSDWDSYPAGRWGNAASPAYGATLSSPSFSPIAFGPSQSALTPGHAMHTEP